MIHYSTGEIRVRDQSPRPRCPHDFSFGGTVATTSRIHLHRPKCVSFQEPAEMHAGGFLRLLDLSRSHEWFTNTIEVMHNMLCNNQVTIYDCICSTYIKSYRCFNSHPGCLSKSHSRFSLTSKARHFQAESSLPFVFIPAISLARP
jgi:hypothetical protein